MRLVARTPAQRGRIGNWLVESRLARGWETQEKARAEIARLGNWKIPQSVYAEWESGRRLPSDANLERLQGFYGTEPGHSRTAAPDDPVAAAIDRQTQMLERLLTPLLAELRQAHSTREREAAAAIEAEVDRLSSRRPDPDPVPSGRP